MTVLPDLRAQLVARITETSAAVTARPKARRRRRSRRTSLLLAAILVVGAAAGATAAITNHSEQQSAQLTSGPQQQGDSGAVLTYGQQIVAAAHRIQATIPYPDGRRDTFDWSTYRPDPGAPSEYEGSLRAFMEFRASCIWRREWVDATTTNDAVRVATAATVLNDVPSWPGIRGDRGSGPSRARAVASSVQRRDVAEVEASLARDCRGF
jgi:hypothetical protein